MTIKITILGSGSKGNATLIHTETEGILLDIGFSRKELISRLNQINFKPENIKGILISHEHSDHIKGLRVFAKQFSTPTYLTADTFRCLSKKNQVGENNIIFNSAESFNIEDFKIEPFSIPHDAMDPVAFIVYYKSIKIAIVTDLGHFYKLLSHKLKDCDLLMIEANHDVSMLRNSTRPPHLIRRILGKHGHLSNDMIINNLKDLLSKKTKNLILAHLSSDCNCPELLHNKITEELKRLNKQTINFQIAKQNEILETIEI